MNLYIKNVFNTYTDFFFQSTYWIFSLPTMKNFSKSDLFIVFKNILVYSIFYNVLEFFSIYWIIIQSVPEKIILLFLFDP